MQVNPNVIKVTSNGVIMLNHPFAMSGGGIFAITTTWCGYCKKLHEAVKKVTSDYNNKYKFFYLDVTNSTPEVGNLMKLLKVSGYPTIWKILPGGILVRYEGSREPHVLAKLK